MARRIASIETMKKFAGDWMRLLGLAHWDVYLRYMTTEEEKSEYYKDANAFVRWNNQHTIAEMAVAHECEDWRHAIVHELLHLRVDGHAPFESAPSGAEEHAREVTINALTKALLSK